MTIVVYGIDPGVTTGVARFEHGETVKDPHGGELTRTQLSYGGSGKASDLIEGDSGWKEQAIAHRIYEEIHLDILDSSDIYVAIEDFIIRRPNKDRDFLSPVRITAGLMQLLYPYRNRVKLVFQSPADAKQVCSDERLKRWGYTIETKKDRHSQDAVRHAILLQRRIYAGEVR